MREVLIVAAEASADLHGAGFARALKALRPDTHIVGVGGAHLDAEGAEILARSEEFAVMGFVEVISHVPKHWHLLRQLKRRIATGSVGVVVVIDYPGFNMKLAAAAKQAGVPVLYYITPQVWAWGAGRLGKLSKVVTKAACILPFEEALLRGHGIDATFVGHPLLDRAGNMPTRSQARERLGLPANTPVLALFPGSRVQEVERHLADAVAAAQLLQQRVSGLHVVVSVAPTVRIAADLSPFPLVRADAFTVLRAADAALCKSGTTTLEAAVAGCPLVIVYRTNALTFAMARRLVRIQHIGLVNVVAGRSVSPEFVQGSFTPSAVADALTPLLNAGSPERARMLRDLAGVRDALGQPGAAARVAAMASGLLATRA